jgi:hypothetical protein
MTKMTFKAQISWDGFPLFQHHNVTSDIWTDHNNARFYQVKETIESTWWTVIKQLFTHILVSYESSCTNLCMFSNNTCIVNLPFVYFSILDCAKFFRNLSFKCHLLYVKENRISVISGISVIPFFLNMETKIELHVSKSDVGLLWLTSFMTIQTYACWNGYSQTNVHY